MSVRMPPSPGSSDAELLRYAEATYQAVTDLRRRTAWVALVLAVACLLAAAWSGLRWREANAAAAAVQDRALVEAFGVSLPDPRPSLERTELRARAFLHGSVAVGAAGLGLISLAVSALLRPAPPPSRSGEDTRQQARAEDQPPM